VNLDDDDTETIGLECEPSGPYAVLLPPFSLKTLDSSPVADWTGALSHHSVAVGWSVLAVVKQWSGRTVAAPSGPVHLRGFDRAGKLLWTMRAERMGIPEMAIGKWHLVMVELTGALHVVRMAA